MENQEINADYLKECFINARQEFMFRVSHRDDYLKIHLLLQAILLALSSGIKISGVEIDTPNPDVLALAVPLAIVFSALYYSDNTLIAQLSAYLRRLDTYKNKSIRFENWDSSIELQKYVDRTFLYRLIIQPVAFVIIPTGLLVKYIIEIQVYSLIQIINLVGQFVLLAILVFILIRSFNYFWLNNGKVNRKSTMSTK